MSKLTLNDIGSGYNLPQVVNANNEATQLALENTLSRDGSAPNGMQATLDMNSNRVINLGSPVNPNDAARYTDVVNSINITGVIAPSQIGNADKALFTDGSVLSFRKTPYISRTANEISAGVIPADYSLYTVDSARYTTLQDAVNSLPFWGGRILLANSTISFAGLVLNKPVVFEGHGAGISNTNVSSTILSFTGSGVCIDIQDGARGSSFRGFQLINSASGTIGFLVNTSDVKFDNVYIYQTTSGFAGFSVAAIRAGSTIEANDILFRDVYIRQQPALGIDLWQVSEATFDHVRLIQNKTWQIKIGDIANGKSCNGLNFVNGTSPQLANDAASGGIKIERSFFKLLFDGCQFESDLINGANYLIDASGAQVCDQIIVANSYMIGSSWGANAAYAIAANLASTDLFIQNVYAKNFSTALVKNTLARTIDYERVTLDGTPQVVDVFSAAVQQWTGTFTQTLTGMTGSVTQTVNFTRNRDTCYADFAGATGTSNATTMTGTGAPAGITPSRTQRLYSVAVLNNGVATNVLGRLDIDTGGVWNFFIDSNGTAFANTGTKGLVRNRVQWTL